MSSSCLGYRKQICPNWVSVMLIVMSVTLWSCDNEIHLDNQSEPLPLIYCLLDTDSDEQYVRLTRTYMGSSTYDHQIPPADSLILPGFHQIYMERYQDNERKELHFFEPYEGAVKDSGLFPAEALALYRSAFRPETDALYRLYIYFPDVNRVHSAEIITMGKTVLIDPAPIYVREITFTETRGFAMRFISAPNSGIYQAKMTVNYAEYGDESTSFKFFDLIMPQRYVLDSNLEVVQTLSPGNFYRGFLKHVAPDSSVERELLHTEFTLFGAGTELALFVKAQLPEAWLSLSQYTNVDNGFGIFSSISRQHVQNLQFSELTKHVLATDSLTRHLNFIDPYQP